MSLGRWARRRISHGYERYGRYSRQIDRLNRLPLLRDFTSRYGNVPCFDTREAMWDHLSEQHQDRIDYLEFGVHEGHSLLHWAGTNTLPQSRFFGFDTFEGLPETWNEAYPKGHFNTGGQAPKTTDPRVVFIKGLFQDSLPTFLGTFELHGRPLIVHIDCDLYASALYCLARLDPYIRPGTIIIFDEFGDVLHEFRAFNDYITSHRRAVELVCAHDNFFTAAVRIV